VTFSPRKPEPIPESEDITPPVNIEAEQALLGALMVRNSAFEKVADRLKGEHFAEATHGRIFDAIRTLIDRGSAATPITMKGIIDLAEVGGIEYLTKLAMSAVSTVNVADYAETIRDCWLRRKLIDVSLTTIAEAQSETIDSDAQDVRERLEQTLVDLQDTDSSGGPRELAEYANEALKAAEDAYRNKGKITGVPTGLDDLDRLLGGLQAGDLLYLAGRPSMGKSALAGTIAYGAAARGYPVILFSPEMSGLQVAQRLISIRSRIAAQRMRRGDLEPNDFGVLLESSQEVSRLPITLDETGGISLSALKARTRRWLLQVRRKMPPDKLPLVIVDYLQLMATPSRRQQNRNEDVSELSRGLKGLAKELGIPLLVLSQLSRQVESRENKHPQLSDLRDSGSLEQDADVVMFVFREEYYLSREEPAPRADEHHAKFNERHGAWEARRDATQNLAEVIVAKQRNGATGKVTLRFDAQTTSFENLSSREGEESSPAYSALGA
jgi:replicative DNA helicase